MQPTFKAGQSLQTSLRYGDLMQPVDKVIRKHNNPEMTTAAKMSRLILHFVVKGTWSPIPAAAQ